MYRNDDGSVVILGVLMSAVPSTALAAVFDDDLNLGSDAVLSNDSKDRKEYRSKSVAMAHDFSTKLSE